MKKSILILIAVLLSCMGAVKSFGQQNDAGNARLVIRNMTGEQLYVNKQLRAGKNNVAIFTRNWAAGIYFCSLEINGAVIATEKLSVTH